MRRRAVFEGDTPTPYETVIHEMALRCHVADRGTSRSQLDPTASRDFIHRLAKEL